MGHNRIAAALAAFEERGKGDRHQFRFIESVEDAAQLADVRDYTRALVRHVSNDAKTRL